MNFGFVYILSNDSMPGIYKVGMTRRSPHQRALELSSATGVASDFIVCHYAEFCDPARIEASVHDELRSVRVNHSREFFKAGLLSIIDVVMAHSPLSEWEGYDVVVERDGLKFPNMRAVK